MPKAKQNNTEVVVVKWFIEPAPLFINRGIYDKKTELYLELHTLVPTWQQNISMYLILIPSQD